MLCGLAAIGLLAALLGWPLGEEGRRTARLIGSGILAAFVFQEAFRLALQSAPLRYLRGRIPEVVLSVLVSVELFASQALLDWLGDRLPRLPAATLTLVYLAGTQVTLAALVVLRLLREVRFLSDRRVSPGLVFMISFAGLIAVGTLLLKTPQAAQPGSLGWIDAFFLATSAVCVTGLSPVDIAVVLTPHGKWILLGLIQLGGLGVMTLTCFFAYFLAGGVGLRSRIALQDLLSEETLGQIGTVLAVTVGFTFAFEIAGALALHALLEPGTLPPAEAVFVCLFHSVSAFCNAGFSTFSANLAAPGVSDNLGFLGVILGLVVVGGIGFPVLKDGWRAATGQLARRLGLRISAPRRLSANSRIVLVTTFGLLLAGWLAIGVTEFAFGSGVRGESAWFTALFHSVTARTAGFNLTPTESLLPATAAVLMALMFVGGSPGGTAGGVKTSTLAVATLALRRILTGREHLEAFGRRFDVSTADRALAIILLAVTFTTLVCIGLCALHPELPPADVAFEAVSAVGTVGLSRGVTAQLGTAGKLLVILAMFVGRIGVLVCLLAVIPRRAERGYAFPETTLILN